MKISNNLFIYIIFISLFGCPVYDPTPAFLNIYNNSDSAIYVYSTCNYNLPCDPKLDLFKVIGGEKFDQSGATMVDTISPNYRVNAFSYGEIKVWGEKDSPQSFCENNQIVLFFIKESVMRSKDWGYICANQLYDKKLIYSEVQLDSLDWVVRYTP